MKKSIMKNIRFDNMDVDQDKDVEGVHVDINVDVHKDVDVDVEDVIVDMDKEVNVYVEKEIDVDVEDIDVEKEVNVKDVDMDVDDINVDVDKEIDVEDVDVDKEVNVEDVNVDVDKGILKEDDTSSKRHIKIAQMTNELMAASTEPGPRYEIVWRKQDEPGNRQKTFIHPRAKENRNDERPLKRKEWLEMGNQLEPTVTVFGPGHFLHHAGYGGGQDQMFQLEDGSVIKEVEEEDDIPEKREPTALERFLMEQRKFFLGQRFCF